MMSKQHYMVKDGSYTCGDHNTTQRRVESLCCMPDTDVTLYSNYTRIKIFKQIHKPYFLKMDLGSSEGGYSHARTTHRSLENQQKEGR